jgi:hypothetical protein
MSFFYDDFRGVAEFYHGVKNDLSTVIIWILKIRKKESKS